VIDSVGPAGVGFTRTADSALEFCQAQVPRTAPISAIPVRIPRLRLLNFATYSPDDGAG